MNLRKSTGWIAAGLAAAMLAPAIASAQLPESRQRDYQPPRLSNGQPDLQGTWSNATLTGMTRDRELGDRLILTEEEARAIEGDNNEYLAWRNQPTDPNARTEDLPVDCGRGFSGTSCGYDNGWTDPGETVMRVNGQARSSFLTTPNGQYPARKAGASVARRTGLTAGVGRNDNPETRSLGERCIMSFGTSSGPIMTGQLYNNNYEFVQSDDHVAILVEMVHDVRVVRLNSTHRTDGVRPWMGDSIGWWEGDTLVVETVNFHPRQSVQGSSENLKMIERFTRVAPDRLLYQFTVVDPTMWDEPWGGEYEFGRSKGAVYEYACHEGNYGLENILAGARAEEAEAALAAEPVAAR